MTSEEQAVALLEKLLRAAGEVLDAESKENEARNRGLPSGYTRMTGKFETNAAMYRMSYVGSEVKAFLDARTKEAPEETVSFPAPKDHRDCVQCNKLLDAGSMRFCADHTLGGDVPAEKVCECPPTEAGKQGSDARNACGSDQSAFAAFVCNCKCHGPGKRAKVPVKNVPNKSEGE